VPESQLRWELADAPQAQSALFDESIFEREPGRGEFRGLEFLHVRAKRIINDLGGTPYGFRYTINAYRGCSHACSYCMSGDTPVLMANGETKALADVQAGDRVYGTDQSASDRRYVQTRVTDHWATSKPAYRITLVDGRELVTSGDHRLLAGRGWQHVAPDHACGQHLGIGDQLTGVAAQPADLNGQRVTCPRELRIVSIEPLGIEIPMYDITTGTGDFIANGVVSHNCFARPTHAYLDLNIADDFDSKIVVKVNAVERVRAELHPRKWAGDAIAMGTNTDPYQRCEGKYRLTQGIIEALIERANPFSILTKSTLILRDLDLLVEASKCADVRVNFSIGTLDEHVWRTTEPGTPHPRQRVKAVAALNQAGVRCGVLVAPILPGLSDHPDQLAEIVHACKEAGAVSISPVLLHLGDGTKEVFYDRIGESHPELLPMYRRMYGSRKYAPKADRDRVSVSVNRLIGKRERIRSQTAAEKPAARPSQLNLL
jgi:DNA repair photolyase